MDFGRRLRLYILGLLVGCVLAWLFLGDRLLNAGWTPEARIKKRLVATLMKASPAAQARLEGWGMDIGTVRSNIPSAEVLVSRTRRSRNSAGDDSLFYTLNTDIGGRPAQMVILVFERYEVDSSATLWTLDAR